MCGEKIKSSDVSHYIKEKIKGTIKYTYKPQTTQVIMMNVVCPTPIYSHIFFSVSYFLLLKPPNLPTENHYEM